MKKLSTPRYESLENGVWVATESLSHVRSASIGIYLDTGSRDEVPETNGLSHFFEHMVFKGTKGMNPLEIVQRFEATGGQVNAYTSKEQTCFYGKVVDTEIKSALEVLLDMVLDSRLDPVDVKKEKEVIIEEIRSVDDSADELVYELFSQATFGSHALGKPIAGTAKSVRALTRKMLVDHRDRARKSVPLVIVAVGRVDHDAIVKQVRKRFNIRCGAVGANGPSTDSTSSPRARSGTGLSRSRMAIARTPATFRAKHITKNKDVQQASVILGGSSYPSTSPQRFPLMLLHCALGDGMSSKLFQNLRETYGLVYSIFSNPEFLAKEGVFNIGFATEPKNLEKAVREIGKELAALRKNGLTAKELASAKKNIIGGILLGLESTSNRMSALARRVLGQNPDETLEEIIAKIEAVTRADILKCANEVLQPNRWGSAAVLPKGVKADLGAMLAKA